MTKKNKEDSAMEIAERESGMTAMESAPEGMVAAFIQENMQALEGQRIQFPQVNMKHGGTRAFHVEDLESGDFALVDGKEGLVANVITFDKFRMFYAKKYNSDSVTPPDCMSTDMVHGQGTPGGMCKDCPKNEWESATNADGEKGAGKACKEMVRLFLMLEGTDIPYQLVLPPSSIGSWGRYAMKQLVKKSPVQMVWTRLLLIYGQNECSLLEPHKERDLLKGEFDVAMDIRRTYGAALAAKDIDQMVAAARASQETRRKAQSGEPVEPSEPPVTPEPVRSADGEDVPF